MLQTVYDVLRPSFQQRKLISATFSRSSNMLVGLVTEHSALRSQMRHFEDNIIFRRSRFVRSFNIKESFTTRNGRMYYLNSHSLFALQMSHDFRMTRGVIPDICKVAPFHVRHTLNNSVAPDAFTSVNIIAWLTYVRWAGIYCEARVATSVPCQVRSRNRCSLTATRTQD